MEGKIALAGVGQFKNGTELTESMIKINVYCLIHAHKSILCILIYKINLSPYIQISDTVIIALPPFPQKTSSP